MSLTPLEKSHIELMYRAGDYTPADIGKMIHKSDQTVRNYLNKIGLKKITPRAKKPEKKAARAAQKEAKKVAKMAKKVAKKTAKAVKKVVKKVVKKTTKKKK